MDIINHLSSSFRRLFIKPLATLLDSAQNSRTCEFSDLDWLAFNTSRILSHNVSGRAWLQKFDLKSLPLDDATLARSTYFESLYSKRRCSLATEINGGLVQRVNSVGINHLADFEPWLADYDVHAGDGHWHQAAAHDPRDHKERKQPVGHLFALNLRSGAASHITAADQVNRIKEHDMRGLKRMTTDALRFGAHKGRKVILIWDKAVI